MDSFEVAAALFRVLETGDAALARRVVAAGNHNREAAVSPAACSIPGPAGTLASGAWMRSAFSELRFPVTDSAAKDDKVWLLLRMRGTHTGPFVRFRNGKLDQAIPPTGREIDFEQLHVVTVRDGEVVRHEALRDDLTMLGQLGVFPPSPSVMGRVVTWRVTGRAKKAADEVTALSAAAAASFTKN
ncbi:ester cyclase [Streptomyces sp. NPDC057137]|uniref:ester cyclase n=1 Tax=Streptomyces sp. NPDC057137 TaxID=3346030 RepID=UPI003629617C